MYVGLNNGPLTLDLVYAFRKSDYKQVEHRIYNMKRYKKRRMAYLCYNILIILKKI